MQVPDERAAGSAVDRAVAAGGDRAGLAQRPGRRPGAAIGMRLPVSLCFVRNVELPSGRAQDLRRILDFDLERATPFKLQGCLCRPSGGRGCGGQGQAARPPARHQARGGRSADGRGHGRPVSRWDSSIAGTTGRPSGLPINFIEPRGGAQARMWPAFYAGPRALAALALLLVVSALVLTFWKLRKRLGGFAGADGPGADAGGGRAAACWNARMPRSRSWLGCRT